MLLRRPSRGSVSVGSASGCCAWQRAAPWIEQRAVDKRLMIEWRLCMVRWSIHEDAEGRGHAQQPPARPFAALRSPANPAIGSLVSDRDTPWPRAAARRASRTGSPAAPLLQRPQPRRDPRDDVAHLHRAHARRVKPYRNDVTRGMAPTCLQRDDSRRGPWARWLRRFSAEPSTERDRTRQGESGAPSDRAPSWIAVTRESCLHRDVCTDADDDARP